MRPEANPTQPLRVLIVHDSLSRNGGVLLTLDLADRFTRTGATAEIFALQPVREGSEAAVPASAVLTRGVPVGGRLRFSAAAAALRLIRACRRADVVVSGSEVGLGLLSGYVAARLMRRPFVIVVHAPLEVALEQWVPTAWQRPTLRVNGRADAAICVSPALVDGVTANGLDPGRVFVVLNAVDVGRVRRLAAAEPAPPLELPTVVGLGRLSPEKEFDLLVRAHAELRRSGVEHKLELIGEGPERGALIRLAAELGVADSVSLPGFVKNQYSRLARAAVVVLPSRHEGMPLVLLEALALDVPVLASRSTGASEVLGPEHLFDDDSVSGLTAALRRLLHDPKPLQAAARMRGEPILGRTLDDVAREYLDVLRLFARGTAASTRRQEACE